MPWIAAFYHQRSYGTGRPGGTSDGTRNGRLVPRRWGNGCVRRFRDLQPGWSPTSARGEANLLMIFGAAAAEDQYGKALEQSAWAVPALLSWLARGQLQAYRSFLPGQAGNTGLQIGPLLHEQLPKPGFSPVLPDSRLRGNDGRDRFRCPLTHHRWGQSCTIDGLPRG